MTCYINQNGLESENGDDPPRKQVDICIEFLKQFCQEDASQTINSYLLKHIVEDWADEYVSNGALIWAADELGYDYDAESLNAAIYLNGSDYCEMKRKEAGTNWLYPLIERLHGDLGHTLRMLDDLRAIKRNDGYPEEIENIPDALRRLADKIESRLSQKRP